MATTFVGLYTGTNLCCCCCSSSSSSSSSSSCFWLRALICSDNRQSSSLTEQHDLRPSTFDLQVLASWYTAARLSGIPLELVYVSNDENASTFEDYYVYSMPFAAVPYSNTPLRMSLKERYRIADIPSLVFMDRLGNILQVDGRKTVSSWVSWVVSSVVSSVVSNSLFFLLSSFFFSLLPPSSPFFLPLQAPATAVPLY